MFRTNILWKSLIITFFQLSPTSSHLHPLQVENCDSNSRFVVVEDGNGKFRCGRVTALGTISNHAYYPNSNIRGMYMWSAIWWKNFKESAPPAAKLDYEAGKQTVILLSLLRSSGPANIAFVSSWLAGYFTEDDKVGVAENCLMVSLPQQIKHSRITVNSAIITFFINLC